MTSAGNQASRTLRHLFGDAGAERFFRDVFEQRALVTHAADAGLDAARFRDVVSIADVDRIVTGTDLKRGDLLLADAARDDGPEESDWLDSQGYVDRGAVAMLYRAGATIILNQAQRIVPELGRLCRGIEHVFSCHVQTNLYLTPAGAQGFPIHFDNHDVIVIQAEGEKLWRLYDMPVDIPYRGEGFRSLEHQPGALRQEFVLKAGDVAYVPRGMMHDAETSGTAPSLHITVGLIARTWADLVLEAVAEVAVREPAFRQSLPPGFADDGFDRGPARARLAELGTILARELKLDPAMDILAENFVTSRASANSGAVLGAHAPIPEGQRFIRLAETPARLDREDGPNGRVRLAVPSNILWFTPESEAAVRRAMDGTSFTVDELAFEHGEAVVRRLLAYAVIAPH